MNWQEYPMQWCDRCKGSRPHSTNGKCLAMHRTAHLHPVPLTNALRMLPKTGDIKEPSKRVPRRRHDQAKVKAAVAWLLAGEVTLQQAAREVGCDTDYLHGRAWKAAKQAVFSRDSNVCQWPDATATHAGPLDAQHRIGRGTGGSSNPLVVFYLPNLITLCRSHHDYIGRYPEIGWQRGLAIPRGFAAYRDPADVPAETIDGLVMLTQDGQRRIVTPPGDAA